MTFHDANEANRAAPATVVDIAGAAAFLGVSSATVRNWLRAGLLSAVDAGRRTFIARDEIERVHNDLQSGRPGGRLRSRANKTAAAGRPRPAVGGRRVAHILQLVARAGLATGDALFLLCVNFLVKRGLAPETAVDGLLAGKQARLDNRGLAAELADFRRTLGKPVAAAAARPLAECALPEHSDVLGFLYQALTETGTRSRSGRFYTPSAITDAVAADVFHAGARVLDPCCGSGQFLLGFARRGSGFGELYGFDCDPLAARIARFNLFAAFPGVDCTPNIFVADALSGTDCRRFDVIVANPPWGARYGAAEAKRLREAYPDIHSGESFAYFLRRSLDLLAPAGRASFILPEAFLQVARHHDIRETLLRNAHVDRVDVCGRVFPDVFTPVVRVDFSVGAGMPEENRKNAFMIGSGSADMRLIDRIHNCPHTTLKDGADWALGVVTGDNRRFLSDRMEPGLEPVIRGRDLAPFRIDSPGVFLRFDPAKMQQVAPERLYRAGEKLVYRFVSKRLVFACDAAGRITLNSANIVIPRLPRHSVGVVAALFNSALYQYLWCKLFPGLKVLRSHLEQLPLPLWEAAILERLSGVADGGMDRDACDSLIMDGFGLTAAERDLVASGIVS